jgi:serine/threonine protein kinase/Flp pilus assembly protein TadD
VYLARDERLGRKVALKFLPERLTADKTQLSRFKSEARAASALNHPNILTVYEIDTERNRHFIATEFIKGVTLRALLARGRINVHDALEIAVQVASALAAAHEAGVVHRDIKPENIMLRPDGYVKVLDFGIAKLTEQQPASNHDEVRTTTTLQTHPGLVMGTARYMSPEQTRGQSADARSDIWSLGVVTYEMVAGVPPFQGETPSDCIASVLKGEPLSLVSVTPGAPTELQLILQKALRKNRNERYQTIAEMLADLRSLNGKLKREASAPKIKAAWIWTGAVSAIAIVSLATLFFLRYRSLPAAVRTPSSSLPVGVVSSVPTPIPEKSVAVLPFDNLSDDKQNAYFAAGVQDEITTNLARIADLKVISRTSANLYKSGNPRNSREIGQQLGVAHLLEGNAQRIGNRLRVNAQLIKAPTDTHVWAQTYERDVADLFAIQSEIAQAIVGQLHAKISPAEKLAIERAPTSNLSAFDLYTHAKDLSLRAPVANSGKKDLLQAADLLNQAVARDPAFFQAYCQLARIHDLLYLVGHDHTPERLALAEAAIQAAFRLRPDAGEAHLARAENFYRGYLDYDGALAELEVARQTLPNDAWLFDLKGNIERRQGRWEEAIQDFERAVDLDPLNLSTLQQIAHSYEYLRRYAEAISAYDRALAIDPNDVERKVARAHVELDWKADTGPLHQVIDSIRATNPAAMPRIADMWINCALAERDPTAVREALIVVGEDSPLNNEAVHFNRPFVEGIIARMTNEDDRARSAFTAARAEQEKTVQAQPNYGPPLVALGVIDAALGRKDEALREGRRAVALLPVEKDSINGPLMIEYLAMIAAWVGDMDLACEQLAAAIRYPSTLSYGQLKLLPFWDPLRGDSRFEQIVASLAPK